MCGGTHSPASRVQGPHLCPACKEGVADLDHLYWSCSATLALRNVAPPADPLARRLGWTHIEVAAAGSQAAVLALRRT
eukprot:15099295-Alexandrium_andersonii.AAC.1